MIALSGAASKVALRKNPEGICSAEPPPSWLCAAIMASSCGLRSITSPPEPLASLDTAAETCKARPVDGDGVPFCANCDPVVVATPPTRFQLTAKTAAAGIFRNAGQVCVAGSRLLVEAAVHDQFVDLLTKATAGMKVGNPLDLTTQIGAVNSAPQLARNLGFIESARAEGGEIVSGGQQTLSATGGYYLQPTIVTQVAETHRLFREEVFGPVLAVTPFDTEAAALRLANATDFGLASGLWTANLSRAHRMVRGIRAGVVHVNTYGGADITVPMGGVKQSGNGHDKSLHAFDKYTDLKTAWIQL